MVPLVVAAALYGAVVGLVLPRAVYQFAVDPDQAWRVACPAGHPLTGWAGRNRCGPCGGDRYGGRVTVFSLLAALVSASLAAVVGLRPELGVWLLAVPVALVLTGVDIEVHRLPDVLTLPLALSATALLGLAALLPGAGGSWRGAVLGGFTLGAAYLVLFLLNPQGMGLGDVKLAFAVGVALGWYGWTVLFVGAFLGFASGALYGLTLVLRRRGGRRTALAFGPFMVLGTWLGLLLGG